MAVKDNIDVAGMVTGLGNPAWAASHPPAARDAAAVARLLAAGATVVGKAHTDEFAYSLAGDNAHYGRLENPAAPGRATGGSSSGPAVAVAGGVADIGLGTDTAGSIRVPASYCGLFGLRPTWGEVPVDGVVALAPSFDTVGLLTRDLDTLGAALECVVPAEPPDAEPPPPRQLAVADDLIALMDPAARRRLERALMRAPATGPLRHVDVGAAVAADWVEAFSVVQAAEFWAAHGAWLTQMRPATGPGVSARITRAARVDARRLDAARAELALIRQRIHALVGDDVLVLPTTPGPPPRPGEATAAVRLPTLRLSTLASIAGLPALSLPIPGDPGNLQPHDGPVGLSLLGPAHAEWRLVALAAQWWA